MKRNGGGNHEARSCKSCQTGAEQDEENGLMLQSTQIVSHQSPSRVLLTNEKRSSFVLHGRLGDVAEDLPPTPSRADRSRWGRVVDTVTLEAMIKTCVAALSSGTHTSRTELEFEGPEVEYVVASDPTRVRATDSAAVGYGIAINPEKKVCGPDVTKKVAEIAAAIFAKARKAPSREAQLGILESAFGEDGPLGNVDGLKELGHTKNDRSRECPKRCYQSLWLCGDCYQSNVPGNIALGVVTGLLGYPKSLILGLSHLVSIMNFGKMDDADGQNSIGSGWEVGSGNISTEGTRLLTKHSQKKLELRDFLNDGVLRQTFSTQASLPADAATALRAPMMWAICLALQTAVKNGLKSRPCAPCPV